MGSRASLESLPNFMYVKVNREGMINSIKLHVK